LAEPAPTRLVLVRHGQSLATVNQVVGGHEGCTGLSPTGREQVEALRDRLAATGELGPVAALVASILPRAVETAEILAPALGWPPVRQDCDVCEIHPGEGDGLPWSEFESRYPAPSPRSRFEPWSPGGESWADFMARAGRALRTLAGQHEGATVVVACHGGVVEASFVALGNLPLQRSFHLATDNASLTEWELRPGDEQWWLRRYNDAAHLRGAVRSR
jgi:2,3-bisphosphoglycerate-dependent phosphoglycerate mutase